jgi:hypothetical protein
MGLLDDAIREHLELKRLRGADQGVVAREEQDALGPVPRRGDAAYEDEVDSGSDLASHDEEAHPASDSPAPAGLVDLGSVGQETVEINMEAELASEGDLDLPAEADRDVPTRLAAPPASSRAISNESLEWEIPADGTEESAGRTELDDEQDQDADEEFNQTEPVEDVLEETPDFLRETPEQERLWFEQRPPRDFDFNE